MPVRFQFYLLVILNPLFVSDFSVIFLSRTDSLQDMLVEKIAADIAASSVCSARG